MSQLIPLRGWHGCSVVPAKYGPKVWVLHCVDGWDPSVLLIKAVPIPAYTSIISTALDLQSEIVVKLRLDYLDARWC